MPGGSCDRAPDQSHAFSSPSVNVTTVSRQRDRTPVNVTGYMPDAKRTWRSPAR
jgi:hypothetical protein